MLVVHDRNESGEICPPEFQVAIADAHEKLKPMLDELINSRPTDARPFNNKFAGWFPLPGLYEKNGSVIGFTINEDNVTEVNVVNKSQVDEILNWNGEVIYRKAVN